MKVLVAVIVALYMSSCSAANIVRGPDDYNENYYAADLRHSIDSAILAEKERKPPNGYLTQPYSRRSWNKYWNDRIFHIYELGSTHMPKGYQGPSGPELIEYILRKRAKYGLPPIELEERNNERVPKA